jgi:flavin-dependent dehydrogenase
MQLNKEYSVAIIGGGLAGLAAAIVLKRSGHSVVLFEKESFPFHKVCGEYISLESWNFLESLGLPLSEMDLPLITKLVITAPGGRAFRTKLPLGGFGISRYLLDNSLAAIARKEGVDLAEETKVEEVTGVDPFLIRFTSRQAGNSELKAKLCLGSWGKKSNMDVKKNRSFLQGKDKRLENYVGIKYHVQTKWEDGLIGLHNFEDGYCGISRIEDDKYCLCYLTKASNLRKANNQVSRMEEEILFANRHLEKIFREARILEGFPVTISQISFNYKSQVEDHIVMLGDAGGMITPLCGNGMSIALHTAKIAAQYGTDFLENRIVRHELEEAYTSKWKEHFAGRLRTGRMIQRFFGSKGLSNLFVGSFNLFPFLAGPLVKMTHGKEF